MCSRSPFRDPEFLFHCCNAKKCELVCGFPLHIIKLFFVQCDVALASSERGRVSLRALLQGLSVEVQRFGLTGSSVDGSVPFPRGDVRVLMDSL